MARRRVVTSFLIGICTLFSDPAHAYVDPCQPFVFAKTHQWLDEIEIGSVKVKYVGNLTHFVNETQYGKTAEIVQEVTLYFEDLFPALTALVAEADKKLPKDDCTQWAQIAASRFQTFPPNLNLNLRVNAQHWVCVLGAKTKGFNGYSDVSINFFPKVDAAGKVTIGSSSQVQSHVSKETQFLAGLMVGPLITVVFTKQIEAAMNKMADQNLSQITDILKTLNLPELSSGAVQPQWSVRYLGFNVRPFSGKGRIVIGMVRTYEMAEGSACVFYRGLNK
ncbi:hypothetical protein E0J20_09325 [Rhizobium leguminosarum bv. viciae]|nr:hypothetical protein E0J20_09325 [Rhizobium leguminosarum bv. viciae]